MAASDKSLRLRSAAILAGVLIALVFVEVAVRVLFRYNTPDTVRSQSLQHQPSLFARHLLTPNTRIKPDEGWGHRRGPSMGGRVYAINDHGTRGKSFLIPKPREVCRVVVLGGSSVFDAYATEGRDWPHLVERALHVSGLSNVEVINAGTPGHASFDSLGRLYTQIWTWDPDYVLFYHGWNDIKYWRATTKNHPLIAQFEPFDENSDPFQNYRNAFDWLLASSQLYVKLRNAYFVRATSVGSEGRLPAGTLAPAFGPDGPRQFRLINHLLLHAAMHIGATPVLVTEASLIGPDNSEQDRARIEYRYVGLTHDALVQAYKIANDVVRSIALEQRTPFLDLAASVSGRSELFVDHVHTTETGSEVVAAAVGEYFASRFRVGSCLAADSTVPAAAVPH